MKRLPAGLTFLNKPSPKAWNRLVAWFDRDEKRANDKVLLRTIGARLRKWPSTILRPLPYYWIHRFCSEEGFAPATLANALSLSDRWVVKEVVTLEDFASLTPEALERLKKRSWPALHTLDHAYLSEANPLTPGTMNNELSLSALLTGKVFAKVRSLDLSAGDQSPEQLKRFLSKGTLRALSISSEMLSTLDELLRLKGIEKLTYLHVAVPIDARALSVLLHSKKLARIKTLSIRLERGQDYDWDTLLEKATVPKRIAAALRALEKKNKWTERTLKAVDPFAGLPGPLGKVCSIEESEE